MSNRATNPIIHGYRAARLTQSERGQLLIKRPWTGAERRIVLHGFFGRLSIAIEPAVGCIVFLGIMIALTFNKNKEILVIEPIFGLGVLAFAAYAIGVMFAPVRALVHSFGPMYIVDGYVRYRGRDARSEHESNGYVAVLTDDRRIACEWSTLGESELPEFTRPAHCEFSEYGGVHRIDGRSTGVLPEHIATLGVGGLTRKREYEPYSEP
jgi:hypothetical protein